MWSTATAISLAVKQLKERCWRYDTTHGTYFVKFYDDEWRAKKVAALHEQLADAHFRYHVPITSTNTSPYIVQRWVEGRAANYERQADRVQTLLMLETLHTCTVNWSVPYMPTHYVEPKWHVRLQRFQEQEPVLRKWLGNVYDVIVVQAQQALMQLPSPSSQRLAVLHGDVVHHNILLGEKPVLIDFDLAHLGDPSEEVVLWLHRVLPHVDYDIERLLQEHGYVSAARDKLPFLRYPNEVLREWLYLLTVDEERRKPLRVFAKALTEQWLTCYARFTRQIDKWQT